MDFKDQLSKLDELLELLKNENHALNGFELKDAMERRGCPVSDHELQRYINQLTADKYIMQDFDYNYMIRIEGLLFEGYAQKIANDASENKRLDTLESYQRAQADTLNRLTLWIAVGSVGLLLIEFLKLWKSEIQVLFHWLF